MTCEILEEKVINYSKFCCEDVIVKMSIEWSLDDIKQYNSYFKHKTEFYKKSVRLVTWSCLGKYNIIEMWPFKFGFGNELLTKGFKPQAWQTEQHTYSFAYIQMPTIWVDVSLSLEIVVVKC